MSLHNSAFCIFLEFSVLSAFFLFFFCSFDTRIWRISYVIARNSNLHLHFNISKDTSIIFYYVDLLLEIICSSFLTEAMRSSVVGIFKCSLVKSICYCELGSLCFLSFINIVIFLRIISAIFFGHTNLCYTYLQSL